MKTALALALCLVASPAFALELVAPRDGGLVVGRSVPIEVETTVPPPCRLDGAAALVTWTRLPFARRWAAQVTVGAGSHTLEVGAVKARFEVVASSVEPAELVARHVEARKPIPDLAWQWGPAVLTYGLHRHSRVSQDRARWVRALDAYYARHATLPRIDYPDVCAPALGALALVRSDSIATGLPAARTVADYLRREPRNWLGTIDHLGANGRLRHLVRWIPILRHWAHSIWVDSLVMYAVFATQYGASQGDLALRDFGAAQPGAFAAVLQGPSGLFAHAYDHEHGRVMGTRWLRGNGWVGTSMVEILDELPASHPRRPEIVRSLEKLGAGLERHQMANGLWDSLTDLPGASYAESSGSALAAYALAKGARLGVLPASSREKARRAFAALTARLERRPTGLSLGGTSVATNAYPELFYAFIPTRHDVDYGVGAYLLLASELANDVWP